MACRAPRCSMRSVLIGNGPTRTGVFPISIDVDDVATAPPKGRTSTSGRRLISSLNARHLIMGVDRLDYTRGWWLAFAPSRDCSSDTPERAGVSSTFRSLSLRVATYPSTSRFGGRSIPQLVRSTGGSPSMTGCRYAISTRDSRTPRFSDFSRSTGGPRHPLRDGMNLVAKEFVAAQRADDPGCSCFRSSQALLASSGTP